MNGALASRARRRAISVLPTPVGPIIRMFLGVISLRSSGATRERRQRLRSAMATARLAASWPMMCLSSSCTISRGVSSFTRAPGAAEPGRSEPGCSGWLADDIGYPRRSGRHGRQLLDGDGAVRVDADVGSDGQGLFDDLPRAEFRVLEQRPRRRVRVGAAGTDGHDVALRLQHVAVAGDDERGGRIRHAQHGFEVAQHAVGAPVLGQFHGGAHEVALVLLQLALEALEQGERIRGAAREAGEDAVVVETPYLPRVALDDGLAQGHLAVAAHHDAAAAPHGKDGGSMENGFFSHGGHFTRWGAAPRPGASALAGARMRAVVDAGEVLEIEVRVHLGGADIRVAEQLLDGPQVAAGLEEMAGEGMAQHVGVHAGRQPLPDGPGAEPLLDGTPADA